MIFETVAWVFAILVFRYYLGTAFFHLLFSKWGRTQFDRFRIQPAHAKESQVAIEKKWTLRSLPVDFIILGVMLVMYRSGQTQVYLEVEQMGWPYFVASLFLLAVLQDAHFYFTHRLLHWRPLFKNVHYVHHLSTNPTPWASFCFHPIEKIIELSFFPIIIALLPLHPGALVIFAFFSALTNILGHSGYEFAHPKMNRTPVLRYGTTSTHHNLRSSKNLLQ